MFNDIDVNDFNGSFRLINTVKKIHFEQIALLKMSCKIIGSLRLKLSKVISPQYLHIVYLDSDLRLHAVFYGEDFLDESQFEIIRKITREILIENKKKNPWFSYTCLPYELKQRKGGGGELYMDYVVVLSVHPDDFASNKIDLLPERQFFHEREFLDTVELVSDTDSDTSSDDE